MGRDSVTVPRNWYESWETGTLTSRIAVNRTTMETRSRQEVVMDFREFRGLAGFAVVLVLLALLVFGILQWLHIPAGNFIDWIIGIAVFWWLLLIVTVPWNVHFRAKEVMADARRSREKNIPVDDNQVQYVATIARRSLWVAIALHVSSTIVLYLLAAFGISAIGYIGSIAALLLTALRPAARAYQYLAMRLASIGKEFKYPREDMLELRGRVERLEATAKQLEGKLNAENPDSWVAVQQRSLDALRGDLTRLASSHEDLRATNQAEHDRLSREAKSAIAQLNEDSQFLEHAREIIRFFKQA